MGPPSFSKVSCLHTYPGKSTLQNELIGDLSNEFGSLPDGSEDMQLSSLGTNLAKSFSGQSGKQLSGLLSKLISSKMPGGFNQQAIRQHLSTRWRLGPHRQTAVICFSISMEPSSRLTSTDAAKNFFDSVVVRYATLSKIELNAKSSIVENSAPPSVVDPSMLDLTKRAYKQDLLKIHGAIGKLVGDNEPSTMETDLGETALAQVQLTEKLNQWEAEYGEEVYSGILPLFNNRKVRCYDSWWNWVRVEIMSFFQDLKPGQIRTQESEDRIRMILNRWTSSCAQIIDYLASRNSRRVTGSIIEHSILERGNFSQHKPPVFKFTRPALAPQTTINASGEIRYVEAPRGSTGSLNDYAYLMRHGRRDGGSFIHLRRRHAYDWKYNDLWTDLLLDTLARGAASGLSFTGKVALVTGAGPGSIAADVVCGLLEGGAQVLVTTSRPLASTADFFNSIYKKHGSKGSKLIVLPFNQGSKQDCAALIDHIYTNNEGYGGDIDLLIPFAAISETGQLDSLDGRSELAHRLMLVNLLRLLGYIKQRKADRNFKTRPTNVILPLSPNHGTFGNDGFYPESKLGLETLFNRYHSETWSAYLTICGAVIGWTRGTGLMSSNNILAQTVELRDCITFTPSEMAFNILALADTELTSIYEDEPVMADLGGNLTSIPDLRALLSQTKNDLLDRSKIRKALLAENKREIAILRKNTGATSATGTSLRHRTNLLVGFPSLPNYGSLVAGLQDLRGMVDLKRTIVVVGFSELGPWGSSRTRWEVEHAGCLSPAGIMEMAWLMGLIDHFDGDIKGKHYVGWLDAKSKEPVHDDELRERYEKHIMSHSGVRFIEPGLFDGYDPEKKEFLHEVLVEEELPPFEASKATAEAFKLRHGQNVAIKSIPGCEEYQVQINKGAHFMLPKAVPFSRRVAGQLPTGFNPARYGIPEDIISQVDPITIYVLCCVCQALCSAGIKDPFELYKHTHVSELANCIGTGVGGLISMRAVYRDRYLDRPVQSDVLQESYLNAMDAWTNMLLLASSGPIKSPVGTCATSVESMDSGCESILLGKAKMAFVGGTDDFQEEMSYEFANMKATSNTNDEIDKGRSPQEMSRPSTSSRSGFMESAGCGVQVITSADMALEMGLPIYAIVAHTQMAGDSVGRSVPAPGQGVLTAAREGLGAMQSPLLNLEYRRGRLQDAIGEAKTWRAEQLQNTEMEGRPPPQLYKSIEKAASIRIQDLQNMWGNDFRRQDPNIAPIRAAMAVWGLTIDDIEIATLHGTSTKANDTNESDVINKQMTKLGRTPGNPLLAISQKSLTGHPKGAAGAWMFNGGLQVLQTGIVPGNRNADNIEKRLQQFKHLTYPSETITTPGINAFMLTSFGFGQKGGIIIAISPRYLFSAITEERFNDYHVRVTQRQLQANHDFTNCIQSNSLFKAKTQSPWKKEDETQVFLDPEARVSADSLTFDIHNLHPNETGGPSSISLSPAVEVPPDSKLDFLTTTTRRFLRSSTEALTDNMYTNTAVAGIGVDVEKVSSIHTENKTFLKRNFTAEERRLAEEAVDPQAFFAGRWSAKEAVFKGLGARSKGGGAAMSDIEVRSDHGVPTVEVCLNSFIYFSNARNKA